MMEKPPPSTCSLSMALMTSSSVMGSALDPLLLWMAHPLSQDRELTSAMKNRLESLFLKLTEFTASSHHPLRLKGSLIAVKRKSTKDALCAHLHCTCIALQCRRCCRHGMGI